MSDNQDAYKNCYGTWKVTTEGDVEGRSTRHLGTFTGYVDDIALALADKCFYSLLFSAEDPNAIAKKTRSQVNISLDIKSGTWDMDPHRRVEFFKKFFNGRPVTITQGQHYASVMLIDGDSPEVIAERERELLRRKALAKLNEAERKVLGLE